MTGRVWTLADGSAWVLQGLGRLRELVDWAGRVMGLEVETRPGLKRVIYAEPEGRPDLPGDGWLNLYWCRINWSEAPGTTWVEMPWREEIGRNVTAVWNSLLAIYRQTLEGGAVPLHAALVEFGGVGYALTGPGGAGKSYICRTLPAEGTALCDDQTLAVPTAPSEYRAHPLPTWSNFILNRAGPERWDCCRHLPLAGVIVLKRGLEGRLVGLTKARATAAVYESAAAVVLNTAAFWPAEYARRQRTALLDACARLAAAVPTYEMQAPEGGPRWRQVLDALAESA